MALACCPALEAPDQSKVAEQYNFPLTAPGDLNSAAVYAVAPSSGLHHHLAITAKKSSKYAAKYRAKYGKEPPQPKDNEPPGSEEMK
jgi:hypothetical protein